MSGVQSKRLVKRKCTNEFIFYCFVLTVRRTQSSKLINVLCGLKSNCPIFTRHPFKVKKVSFSISYIGNLFLNTFNMINIKPYKHKEYNCKQSSYGYMACLPARILLNAPSGTGKTVALTNLVLDIYKGCFEKIYIFSPTIFIDDNWTVVNKYIDKEMDIKHTDEDPIYFDTFEEKDLKNVIDTQEGIIKYMKEKDYKHLYNICIIIDDWADNEKVVRKNKELIKLFTKGRHWYISTFITSQSYTQISPVVRKNATQLFIFRLRNQTDLDAILEELSGLYDKKTLDKIYRVATNDRHGFLYIDLTESDKKKMFYKNLKERIQVE